MNYTVKLDKMYFRANHGLYDFEKEQGNDFFLNVEVKLILPCTHVFANIEHTTNYEIIAAVCKKHMAGTYDLMEQVAHIIALDLFQVLPLAGIITVEITKSKPPMDLDCAGSVVKLEVNRGEIGR